MIFRAGCGGHWWREWYPGGWRAVGREAVWPAAIGRGYLVAVAAVAVALAGCGPSGAGHASSPATSAASPVTAGPVPSATGGSSLPQPSPGLATSCRSVVHIGDSTSDGLVLPAYQPRARLRSAAQYRRVGVTDFISEVSGARSIVETWHGLPNGQAVAQQLIRRGYHGCWVIALGTNDTANVAVGSAVGLAARIRLMMSLIGNQPVLWVNVITLLAGGPYAEYRMRQWNRALLQACVRYPDMRVYDWAAAAKPGWFVPDGIHYTPYGYARRAHLIANALARAFPATQLSGAPQPSPSVTGTDVSQASCLVR
jgi:lysophospholipase L1-like esterase